MVLGELGLSQVVRPLNVGARRLTVRAYYSAARRNCLIQQLLHHRSLVEPAGQTHAIALPVGPRPVGLKRQLQAVDTTEQFGIARQRVVAARHPDRIDVVDMAAPRGRPRTLEREFRQ
jgi:hypothetical protein